MVSITFLTKITQIRITKRNMSDFVTRDIEYLKDELSKVNIKLPRHGYKISLYDILAYMTRFANNVYLVKLKDGRYRVGNDLRSTLFENNTEVEALYDMVMSFIKNGEEYCVTPPQKPAFMLPCDWEMIWGKPNKPRIKYAEL